MPDTDTEPQRQDRASRLATMARALRHRNYRLFFFGQGTSLVGSWLTRVAMAWLVYRLTGSAFQLGLVTFAGQVPTFLVTPFAGVLVERWNLRRVLVVTQVGAMIQAGLLAVLTLLGVITVPQLYVLAVVQGLINAFDMPARQSFVVDMVERREDLANAIALNSSLVNAARLIGPSVGGLLIAAVGEGWCFAIDAASYIAVVGSLLAMRGVDRERAPGGHNRVLTDLVAGFGYVRRFAPIRAILVLLAITSLFGVPYSVLMPIFADDILAGGSSTYGILMGASGVGALAGALWLASRESVVGLGAVMVRTGTLFGLGLIAFGLSRWTWLSVVLMAVAGCGMMILIAAANTLLQTLVDETMRARVMSFYAMSFFGMAPLGSLGAGTLAERIGAPATVVLGGAATVLGVVYFARKLPKLAEVVIPIYRQMGILPEIAEGLSQATPVASPRDD